MLIIIGKPECSRCDKTKKYLEERNIPYQYKTLNEDISLEQLRDIFSDVSILPAVLDDEDVIGTSEDLVRYLKNETPF